MSKKNAPKNLKASYDAVATKGRRRQNVTNLRDEDDVLAARDRDKLVSEARILRRNYPIVGWAIRKHLDYVSTFTFQSKSGDGDVDDRLESLIGTWSLPQNCDVAGRHDLHTIIRLLESGATVDGDCFLMKLRDGKVQLIEGDRVRNPTDLGEYTTADFVAENWSHGVDATYAGKAKRYAVCERTGNGNGFALRSIVQAQYVYQHGYYDRPDQLRGISPIAAAINGFADLYEAQEYALAKMKLSQLFALKMQLEGDDDGGTEQSYDLSEGPKTIQLGKDEDAEFLESKTPSTEFQAFMVTGIAMGLKALDIPLSFYDEAHTNYSGSRIALLAYEQSAEQKRNRLRRLLNDLTRWRLSLYVADGTLVLPEGMTVDDITFEWVAAGLPWIDPVKEATANDLMIKQGTKSRQQICKEQGQDWFDIMDQLKQEADYAKELGLPLGDTDAAMAAIAATANAEAAEAA